MAVIKQGILGGFQNKIGNVVGTSWKGIAVMKSLPVSVANPKTAGQVAQRNAFKSVALFAGMILATIIKPLWDRFAQRMSGYNMFIQRNISLFNASGLNTPADLVISSGKMSATAIASGTASAATKQVTLNWTDDSGEGFKQSSDSLFVVVYNDDTQEVEGFEPNVVRSEGTATITTTLNLTSGDLLFCYIAFRRSDGTIVSDTAYRTVTVAA